MVKQNSYLSYLRSGTDLLFSKTHVHSGIHQSPETPTAKPQSPRMVAAGFVSESTMISRVFHLFQMSHGADQTVLGIERPKTGMFTFDKSAGKNSLVVSGAAHTHTHTQAHSNTYPPGFVYSDLNLALWRASKGGYLRQMSSEKQGCLKSHPQKECTPAWILHRQTPRGPLRLCVPPSLVRTGSSESSVTLRQVIKDDDYVACFTILSFH